MNTSPKIFMECIDNLDDKSYLLSMIAYNAAPALGRVKPSYLIIFHNKGKRKLYDIWQKHKHNIKSELNIKYYKLKTLYESEAVLFYNEDQLELLIKLDENLSLLQRYGYYREMSVNGCLKHLGERYEELCPHEMGIFLGYPVEDVEEFIEHPHKKALMFGYWKVYYNLEKAMNTFNIYDEMKNKVMELIGSGVEPYKVINSIAL